MLFASLRQRHPAVSDVICSNLIKLKINFNASQEHFARVFTRFDIKMYQNNIRFVNFKFIHNFQGICQRWSRVFAGCSGVSTEQTLAWSYLSRMMPARNTLAPIIPSILSVSDTSATETTKIPTIKNHATQNSFLTVLVNIFAELKVPIRLVHFSNLISKVCFIKLLIIKIKNN